MDLKFVNKCTYTYDYYLQLKRKTMDRGFITTCYVFLASLAVIILLCLVKGWFLYSSIPIIGVVFVLYRLIGTPIRLASFSTRKNREIHGKDIETQVDFYEDHLLATNLFSGGKTNIKYIDVIKLLETKNLIVLEMEEGLVIMLDKNGFTKGTMNEAVEFLKNVCINAEVEI